MNVQKKTYEPVEVEFHGQRVTALWDGNEAWVVVKRICENLGVAPWNQIKKIQENKAYDNLYHAIMVQQPSGAKETFCIHLDALTLWLASIQPGRVKEEVRDKLIQYQRECMTVLTAHFFGKTNTPPSPSLDGSTLGALLQQNAALVANINNTSAILNQMYANMQAVEAKVGQVEKGLEAFRKERDDAKEDLLAVPEAPKAPPERSLRSLINEVVRKYAAAKGMTYRDVWNKLYREFYYRHAKDLKTRAANSNCKPLDVAERLDLLQELYDLAYWIFVKEQRTSLPSPS